LQVNQIPGSLTLLIGPWKRKGTSRTNFGTCVT
jgi:hypothetical protein